MTVIYSIPPSLPPVNSIRMIELQLSDPDDLPTFIQVAQAAVDTTLYDISDRLSSDNKPRTKNMN